MIAPLLAAGIVEADEFLGFPDNRADVAAFVAVAEDTGVGKILGITAATVLQADHMVDRAAQCRIDRANSAIFITLIGPIDDFSAEILGKIGAFHVC